MSTKPGLAVALRVVGAVTTIVVAVVVAAISWADSGPFALALAGVPTAAAAPVLILTLRHRPGLIGVWVAAVVVLAWALLTGLGEGFYFLAPGALLLVAALATTANGATTRGEAATAPSAR